MTLLAQVTITSSDDPGFKEGETYHLILTPDQLIPGDQLPAGAGPAASAESPGETPPVPAG